MIETITNVLTAPVGIANSCSESACVTSSARTLVQGAGDHGGDARVNGTQPWNTFHSVFMWKDDGKVYLVGTDNEEFHDERDTLRLKESAVGAMRRLATCATRLALKR